jgi:hypothetical protein
MLKGISEIVFSKEFQSNEDCFMYWAEYMWPAGLSCSSCGCTEDVKGRAWFFKQKVQPIIKELHKQIMLFKNWLRGIHYKCSKQHLYAYLKKQVYRFNRRNKQQWLFNEIIAAMRHTIIHPNSIILIV